MLHVVLMAGCRTTCKIDYSDTLVDAFQIGNLSNVTHYAAGRRTFPGMQCGHNSLYDATPF
jgi:hypothetical protein